MALRDELGPVFREADFADLFPAQGQPALSPGRLALVIVLQHWEGLSDRQAADAVRGRIDWKYALGLELTDPGFDFSVLSEFRDRLVDQQASNRLLDVLLEVFKARGLLKARGRQRTDSTYILEAARELNRLERAGETVRSTLNTLAQLAPEWLKRVAPAEWFARYRRRFDDLHLPRAQAERERLVEQIGRDGRDLLQLLDHPAAPPELALCECVTILRTIWKQQYHFEEKDGQIRVIIRRSGHLPPVREQILSPYETEARFCVRSELKWEGYRVHLTESCDAEAAVHLVTHVETAPAPEQDETALPRIHAALHRRGLLPKEHLLDAGYVSADLLVKSLRDYGVEMVGPLVQDVSWQARAKTGYDVTHFMIDWDKRQGFCPQGQRSSTWHEARDRQGLDWVAITWRQTTCRPCPARSRCTRSLKQGRHMRIRPRLQTEAIRRVRAAQTTDTFKQRYEPRMGVEGTLSQAIRAFGLRRSRYFGLAKTHLQMVAVAVAMNLERYSDYLFGYRPIARRVSPFAALGNT